MKAGTGAIDLAEQDVVEARLEVLANYHSARAQLRRRVASPMFIGGALLGVIAVGYFALVRDRPRRVVYAKVPGPLDRIVAAAQVLMPLMIAFNRAPKAARRPGVDARGPAT